LKRLEGEVLNALDEIGFRQGGLALEGERADATAAETVDPHNLLGIELNPRAAAIAEVVLWIGYLQWHFRTRGNVNPPEPVIRDFHNVENRDAVLAYDKVEYVTCEDGRPVTRWDGRTMKVSPVTGAEIPDERATVPLERYVNARKAPWPAADFVVGNPPFIGVSAMRRDLGDGYVDALRSAWEKVPESADLVMFWWQHAADLTARGALGRFGFITTNSLRQTFNRRVLEPFLSDSKQPLSLTFVIPDHPWVDTNDGADVRISMTSAVAGICGGRLLQVTGEKEPDNETGEIVVTFNEYFGTIHPDLRVGANVASAKSMLANADISNRGVQLFGAGFIVSREDAEKLREGSVARTDSLLREYRNGRDLNDVPRNVLVIDAYGLSAEELRQQHPATYQRLLERIKPERDNNNRESRKRNWWLFGETNPKLRKQLGGLPRYIATVETSKHRTFQFLDASILPDNMLVAIAMSDATPLGVLSSIVHVTWALAEGGRLGVGNDPRYNKARCFETFPFPNAAVEQSARIRALADQLDAHRKRQQTAHSGLTLTGMYNVLEKLRSGEPLTANERTIHEQGLISVVRQLHDELDAAVLDVYGWSNLLPLLRVAHGNDSPAPPQTREDAVRAFEEAVLERLVALNAERAAEEARGLVRWLRPEFQTRRVEQVPQQSEMETEVETTEAAGEPAADVKLRPKPWPKDPIEQVRAVADALSANVGSLSIDDITARFTSRGPWKKRVEPLLDMLVVLGRASERGGRYRARN
jgi:hypothetical protein